LPAAPNPKVTLSVFDLEAYQSGREQEAIYTLQTEDPLDIHDRIVTEVAWVGDHDLMVRESTRAASRERIAHFDFLKKDQKGQVLPAKVTRDVDYEKLDGGWAEAAQTIHAIDAFSKDQGANNDVPPGYLDMLPDRDGFSHLVYFSPADAAEPVFLTSGDWEIDGGVQAVDLQRQLM
jgi:dipeptidyl aminopeptidase